jgi:hypothetical protein
MYTIDVSDLYDAFHACAVILHGKLGFGMHTEPSFEEIVDQLELEVFLTAIAIRLANIAGDVDPDDIPPLLRVREKSGEIRSGAAGTYHSHGFEPDEDGHVANRITPGNLVSRDRSEVDLVVSFRRDAASRQPTEGQEIS